jgi:hypothetical protein
LKKKIADQFGPEEKKHLSLLGSMLHTEPSAEGAEADKDFEAVLKHGMMIKGKIVKPGESAED